jgi:hypothetical protein
LALNNEIVSQVDVTWTDNKVCNVSPSQLTTSVFNSGDTARLFFAASEGNKVMRVGLSSTDFSIVSSKEIGSGRLINLGKTNEEWTESVELSFDVEVLDLNSGKENAIEIGVDIQGS